MANTATLIYGDRDAVLVDTFLTIEQNQQLVDWVKARERNLAYIYITHGHGDHYFGVKQLVEACELRVPSCRWFEPMLLHGTQRKSLRISRYPGA